MSKAGLITSGQGRLLLAATVVALAAGCAGAAAAVAASSVSVAGDTITLSDAVGERNDVTVNHGNNPAAIANVGDRAGITPVAPCFDYFGLGFTCPTSRRPTFVLDLGGGDDFAQVINAAAAGTHSDLRGGPGNDRLWSYEGSDSLDGGAGTDELIPDHDDPSPGDDVRGGSGVDHLQLAPAVSSQVVATLDDRSDDGAPGERDNYRSDIENVTGAQTGRNRIVGSSGPNILTGQEQADRLAGASGRDQLTGRGGSDTLDALDGAGGDRLDCGDGADVAYADAADVVAKGCERRTYAPALSSSKLRFRDRQIAVRLSCPRASRVACSGSVRLTTTTGRRIAKASYRVRQGGSATVRLNAPRKPARAATLVVAPRGTRPIAGRAVSVR